MSDNQINIKDAIEKYISSLDEMELIALDVAKQQLESSFEIHKSIGFNSFLKKNSYVIIE